MERRSGSSSKIRSYMEESKQTGIIPKEMIYDVNAKSKGSHGLENQSGLEIRGADF